MPLPDFQLVNAQHPVMGIQIPHPPPVIGDIVLPMKAERAVVTGAVGQGAGPEHIGIKPEFRKGGCSAG